MRFQFKEVFYPILIFAMIACLWTMGWASSLAETAERRYWPPADPDSYQRACDADRASSDLPLLGTVSDAGD